ncbi:hypothetical protein [Nitrosococcus wardiae]|uniref:hypothetical protein n=1 Tax=Nitrosococcus wardiae TaxID=1814290 RepID=UPI001F10C925|nr:hypothetical protein [Nitrosococcus wardiae]
MYPLRVGATIAAAAAPLLPESAGDRKQPIRVVDRGGDCSRGDNEGPSLAGLDFNGRIHDCFPLG